ncbi:putative F-box only protein 15 [Cardamine amara subsp. amara]|uniref:F-box only protein 15 n=1 Tax=Cardamine amara subsp. amara TaxID=228776 RepID=A0ABD1BZN9_CARAN
MASSKRASSMRLLLPSLPSELIEEILYRTPADSLIRFKSTCKKWYDLITNNKRFIYNHLNHSPERFIRIDHATQSVQIMDPVTIIQSDSPIPNEFQDGLYPILSMVHCDGLMLCLCRNKRNSYFRCVRTTCADLVIWNPVMRKIKWIEPSVYHWESDYFGIGYNNTCRDNYKILRFWGPLSNFQESGNKSGRPECEMYEFKSESWRTLDAKFDGEVDNDCKGVSVEGNMYWIATKEEGSFILCFDFSMETFKNICVCPPYRKTRRLSCFNGDRLSLLQQDDKEETINEIEVWMTNKLSDDGAVSFTKYFNVNTPDLPALLYHTDFARPGYSIGKYRNIMAWCEGKVKDKDDTWCTCITFYDIDEGGIRKQRETRFNGHDWMFICSYVYVPSLIPVVWCS